MGVVKRDAGIRVTVYGVPRVFFGFTWGTKDVEFSTTELIGQTLAVAMEMAANKVGREDLCYPNFKGQGIDEKDLTTIRLNADDWVHFTYPES